MTPLRTHLRMPWLWPRPLYCRVDRLRATMTKDYRRTIERQLGRDAFRALNVDAIYVLANGSLLLYRDEVRQVYT